MFDYFAIKNIKWVGRITNQRNKLQQLLKDVFEDDCVVVFIVIFIVKVSGIDIRIY